MKSFIVACNNGVATSQTIASKVQSLLDSRGIEAHVEAVDIKSIETYLRTADAYICIIPDQIDVDIPVINGVAFLTGVGLEEELDKLVAIAQA
ncbi:MAG: PTS sugar transporter subunit IIB [Propionicimonas sp.]